MWENERMREEWAKANLLVGPIHKKGDKVVCKNYRGIALLNATYKVLSIAINRRLVTWAERIVGEYQSGFRQGRSATDTIFSIRQVLEKIYEHNADLHHLFVDFKQTYDSIDQGSQTQIECGPVRQPKNYCGPHLIFSSR
jgi:sorting nexin-29